MALAALEDHFYLLEVRIFVSLSCLSISLWDLYRLLECLFLRWITRRDLHCIAQLYRGLVTFLVLYIYFATFSRHNNRPDSYFIQHFQRARRDYYDKSLICRKPFTRDNSSSPFLRVFRALSIIASFCTFFPPPHLRTTAKCLSRIFLCPRRLRKVVLSCSQEVLWK